MDIDKEGQAVMVICALNHILFQCMKQKWYCHVHNYIIYVQCIQTSDKNMLTIYFLNYYSVSNNIVIFIGHYSLY